MPQRAFTVDSMTPAFRRLLCCFIILAANASTAALAQAGASAAETNPMPAAPPVKLQASETLGQLSAPNALPATMSAAADARAGQTPAELFPRYEMLKPVVAFWTRVFGEYSELQSVVHSMEYPHKVYTVLDFREAAQRLSKIELARLRSDEEQKAKAAADDLLRRVHELRQTPEQMNAEERRIYEMFADIPDDTRFLDAVGDNRAQRGLKERTEQAFAVSEQYLPEMERIFESYGLPKQLTRLPLVESSFNIDAYSKVGAAGLWQFIPSSARIYMRLNDVVDDRRDPWTSTDAAARHLRDDYALLGSWPLALTAYNHGRGGISSALRQVGGTQLTDLLERHRGRRFGFASRNFYAEFLAASDVEREYRRKQARKPEQAIAFDIVETRHYVPYETLRRLCDASDEVFRKLNPAYRPEVIEGKLYVPPNHLIRVPAGQARSFEVAYAKLGAAQVFGHQRLLFQLYKVRKGDTLSRIAKHHGVAQSAVLKANELKSTSKLKPGQVLKIPPHTERRPGPVTVAVGESQPAQTVAQQRAESSASKPAAQKSKPKAKTKAKAKPQYVTHKVKPGQTLTAIAKRYRVSVAALREANNLGESSHLSVGMKLKVPTRS